MLLTEHMPAALSPFRGKRRMSDDPLSVMEAGGLNDWDGEDDRAQEQGSSEDAQVLRVTLERRKREVLGVEVDMWGGRLVVGAMDPSGIIARDGTI